MRIVKISADKNAKSGMNVADAFRTNEVAGILMDSIAGSGPFDGGCLIAAKALQRIYGGDLVRIVSLIGQNEQTEHFGLLLPNGRIVDAAGEIAGTREWMDRFAKAEGLKGPLAVRPGVPAARDIPDTPDDPVAVKKLEQALLRLLIK